MRAIAAAGALALLLTGTGHQPAEDSPAWRCAIHGNQTCGLPQPAPGIPAGRITA